MSITTDLNAWWVVHQDYQESNSAKGDFQNTMSTFDQMLDELKRKNDNGDFDQLPASSKAVAVWAWQQWNTVRNTVKANADFLEFIGWRKP